MVRARARRDRRRVLPRDPRGHDQGLGRRARDASTATAKGLDLNRNFPSLWRQEFEQVGAGPYPTSEPEVRAMVDFCVAHPNIGAAVSFHTHSGVILRPMGTTSDDDMTPEDLWMIKRLSDIGAKLTGYPAISDFHDFKYHPKEVITGTQDWLYEHLGALCWTVEIWAPEQGGRHRQVRLDPLVPRPSARGRPEAAEVERRAVRRPGARRLEAVRASAARPGGDRRLGSHELLAQPAAAPARARGRALSGLAHAAGAVAAAAGGAAGDAARRWATTATRRHLARAPRGGQRRLPAGVCDAARQGAQGRARHRVRDRAARRRRRWSPARRARSARTSRATRPRSSLQAFLPDRDVTADRTLQEWIVRGAARRAVVVEARADRAGAVRRASRWADARRSDAPGRPVARHRRASARHRVAVINPKKSAHVAHRPRHRPARRRRPGDDRRPHRRRRAHRVLASACWR